MRALVMGKRAAVVSDLADALGQRGHEVVVSSAGEASSKLSGEVAYDVVAFGRAVKDEVRRKVMDQARGRNPRSQRVDGLAPITDLLVVQCEWAARRSTGATDGDPRVLVEAVPVPRVVVRPVGDAAVVEVVRHKLTPWFSTKSETMIVERDGTDVVAHFGRQPSSSRDFVSVRVDGEAVFVGDSLGRLPLCQ